MTKQYYFLAGLPRSGNTLLSSILNQNPEIYCSPLSTLNSLLDSINVELGGEHNLRNISNTNRTKTVLKNLIDVFYSDVDKNIIIDREKSWGTPGNLFLLKKYITPTPKIIFTVRNILDILASFINVNNGFLDDKVNNSSLYASLYREKNDVICDYLMSPNGDIDRLLLSLSSAFLPENKDMFHIVEYDDLIKNPDETMKKIYTFLDLPNYTHNFNEVIKIEFDNNELVGLPSDLHVVKPVVSFSSTNSSLLSEYVKNKYSNMEFWRKDSLIKVKGKDF